MTVKHFGSGNFGEWIEDSFGLPAYRYTCNQYCDARAVTPTNPVWRDGREHWHQVGNDRLVAVATNYGFVQVRQDEGSPKFLNDYDPHRGHYAGGFGYLTDGKVQLSTFYSGQAEGFERVFGIGYLRKTVRSDGYSADQVILAPFGDDPLLISQVTITNHTDQVGELRWIEYWGSQTYQFSYRAFLRSLLSRGKRKAPDLRRELAKRFNHHFSLVAGYSGLRDEQRFSGYPFLEKVGWALSQVMLATMAKKISGGPIPPPVKEASMEDYSLPPTFLVSLDQEADGFATDEAAFFGEGGPENPDSLHKPLSARLQNPEEGQAFFLQRNLTLQPGGSQTLYFAYGYLPEGVSLEALLDRYRRDLPKVWERSCAAWKTDRIRLEIPGEDWVDRELTWHHYYLRSGMTYDSFFGEHILSQGVVYQYLIGFQGAARDPLQHALPFIYTCPGVVKEILRYTLKEVQPDGEIPYGIVGHGMRMVAPYRPSDQELWLLWLASEYVLATRDSAFLNEVVPTYPLYGPKAVRDTVRGLLARCYRHLSDVTGIGQHGLLRLSNGDWNDGVVVGFVKDDQRESVRRQGESVLNAAFATYALGQYALLLEMAGEVTQAAKVRELATMQRRAVGEQWTGRWFKRAWLNDQLGWLGEDLMWLEPQPWAIIGGAATLEQCETLVREIDQGVRQPSAIGAMILSKPIEQFSTGSGVMLNAGVWASINGTLIWALAEVDGGLAWEEWKKNTLAWRAEAYPDVWYGIWSGPDAINSLLAKVPGQTLFAEQLGKDEMVNENTGLEVNWTDFPIMCLHPHGWPLYDLSKLLGVNFTPQGLVLSPVLPLAEYRFESPLLGLEKSSRGYRGWYAPSVAGSWQVSLRLPEKERQQVTGVVVNGQSRELDWTPDGKLVLEGESSPGEPMRWEVG